MKLKEVQRLVESEDRIVVTFMGGVYDITDFTGHPGGYGRLEMVAGYDLEPFWKIYTQHNRGHILQYLQRYQIGRLSDDEAEVQRLSTPEFDNPYKNDPPPYDTLLTNTRYPYNAEGRLRNLADSFFTPAGQHYVRNHGLVPDIKPDEYRLTVRGVGCEEKVITLDELKDSNRFEQVDVTTVIQCNGNRREDYHFINPGVPAFGPPHWVAGAIGNATWTGVRLRDVLKDAGLPLDEVRRSEERREAGSKRNPPNLNKQLTTLPKSLRSPHRSPSTGHPFPKGLTTSPSRATTTTRLETTTAVPSRSRRALILTATLSLPSR